ncbi:hypothetical protein [Helicobacter sp. MIT 05-5294]|uniref:hypothetical protein n=1 Tax=Helicobacter sp. MIT 05-5294 TaxID=1548150 RepID=UPI00051FB11A|nr:hypothetical protein [Helicobacter sp. MIT 05-5294]TLD87844.1 hypothetical protein LS69_003375 [Helicobacter sp. MIT 05-5294]
MALPFIAGLAVGAGVALLFTKQKQIKETLMKNPLSANLSENLQKGFNEGVNQSKKVTNKALQAMQNGLEKTSQALKKLESKQEVALDAKDSPVVPKMRKTRAKKAKQEPKKD